jgi:uncharacterized protein YdaU (DUF1376 family)
MADSLPWFPVYRSDWMDSVSIAAMLAEQEGAYWRLLVISWGDGSTEPSLPTDDDSLAVMSKLGARWKKLGRAVRAQFQERDGRLYNAKLSSVWLDQQHKHAAAVTKGAKGGHRRAANRKQEDSSDGSPTTSPTNGQLPENTGKMLAVKKEEAVVSAPSSAERQQPAWIGALAPVGAAPRAPDANGHGARSARDKKLLEAYTARVHARFEAWVKRHPDEYQAIEDAQLAKVGTPGTALVAGQLATLRMLVIDAWKQLPRSQAIPTFSEWVAEQESAAWGEQDMSDSPPAGASVFRRTCNEQDHGGTI